MIYRYLIDGNDKYEDWMCTEIFSEELLSKEEFEEVVLKAQKDCGEFYNDWNCVAKKIVENDERFFFPERGLSAIIDYTNENKFDGVY